MADELLACVIYGQKQGTSSCYTLHAVEKSYCHKLGMQHIFE